MFTQPETERSALAPTVPLQVRMLGPPEITWINRPLTVPRRQVRALLYRLATRLTPLPREHLCCLFWSDIPECTAHRNLSHLLTHLRHSLPNPEVVQIVDDRIALNPHQIWSDTMTFKHLYPTGAEVQPYPKALQQAVNLYRGSFLTGFSLPTSPQFELWISSEQSQWERLYLEALTALIRAEITQGNYHLAIDYAHRYLAIDELAEEMHRRLITLYAAIGDRKAALRQFENCTVALERHLGIGPLPETHLAYRAVLEGRSLSILHPTPLPTWTTFPSLNTPLVGRDQALRYLKQTYACTCSGQGKVVLISGEPGIGKSRLIQDFVTKYAGGKATVIVGGGHEAERGLPYWPLIEALRPYLEQLGQATSNIDYVHLAELARLWPELQNLLPDLPTPSLLEPGQERVRLFQALTAWLLSLVAQNPPLILCLDDLHWIDEATLSLIGYLARQLMHTPLMVLGAYRSEEQTALDALRTELIRLGLLEEIKLAGLSQTQVLQLIHNISGQPRRGEQLSRHLHREIGGNPFFLLETLRAMFESGSSRQANTGRIFPDVDVLTEDYRELPLPETVSEAIRSRLAHLTPRSRQVLEAGAVIGCRFSFDLVHATSGRHEHEVIEALDELLARQLLIEDNGGYRFRHNLIRTVVHGDLSYGRRRLLHRRTGEALEKLQPDQTMALARHFEQAEEPGKAAKYAMQAGLAAKAVFAYADARAHFDHVLTLLEQEASILQEPEAVTANLQLRVQALARRGWTLRLLGEMEAYVQDSREVARLARQAGDDHTLAHLRWREAYTYRWFCRYAQARAAAEEGLRLSQAASDTLLEAMCQRELGLVMRETGDTSSARANLEQVLQRFVALNETVRQIHTLGNLATLCTRQGEYERAVKLARQALTRCEEAELPFERRLPLGDLGAAAVQVGDRELARQCLLESLAIARQISDCTQEIFCLGHLGWLCLRLKRPTQAQEFLQTGLSLAKSIDSHTEQSWLWSGLAEANRLVGELDLALEQVRWALELAQISQRPYDQELALQILVKLG